MKTWRSVSLLPVAFLLGCWGGGDSWDDPERLSRFPVTVRANGFDRVDRPVTITGDFTESVRVVEVDQNGRLLDDAVPFQVDYSRELTFLMKGETPADGFRLYRVYLGGGDTAEMKALVSASDGAMQQGQESFLITSPGGSYYFHKRGGGFASLIDKEGQDWITHRPEGGSDGKFRGIPNLIHPEGGLHPGDDACDSRLLSDGPLMAKIHSECHEGAWEAEWEIYPGYATLTVLKVAHPYWMLYEGTPAGQLDPGEDYWMTSDGTRRPVSEDWQGRLEPPRWVCFGDSRTSRVLFLAHHEDDGEYDQFRQMEGNMTVFGFGRQYRCCEKSLDQVPAHFTVGFVEFTDHNEIRRRVEGAYRDLIVSKGEIEKRQ